MSDVFCLHLVIWNSSNYSYSPYLALLLALCIMLRLFLEVLLGFDHMVHGVLDTSDVDALCVSPHQALTSLVFNMLSSCNPSKWMLVNK